MPQIDNLLSRIDAEFSTAKQEVQKLQSQRVEEFKGREQRLEQFNQVLDQLREITKPRLEALAKRFGEQVQVTPTVTPERRRATFTFNSPLARINLAFSAYPDQDVRQVVFTYDLQIVPILMKFESHAEREFPLDAVDQAALAQWIDDRIVTFVRTYLSLHQNQYYLKGHLVEDPIARVQFPTYAAGATLDWQGKKYYFIGEETRREFEQQQGIASK